MLAPYSNRVLVLNKGQLTSDIPTESSSVAQSAKWRELWEHLDAHGTPPLPIRLSLRGLVHRYRGSNSFSLGPIDADVNHAECADRVWVFSDGQLSADLQQPSAHDL